LITKYQIRVLVRCKKYGTKFPRTMFVTVSEEDGMPLFPPYTDGCIACSMMAPCPACIAYIKNEVFRSMPLASGATIEIAPEL
jgi:hypothetical protein